MTKMGEMQIIEFFSSTLKDKIRDKHGKTKLYTIGNFSGSQDRKFADFFAGTDAVNILIEFKEFKSEYENESIKPLRRNLCQTLTNTIAELSRSCHFIGWGTKKYDLEIELSHYIDLVCRLFPKVCCLNEAIHYSHEEFTTAFIEEKIGVSYAHFVRYIEHLNKIAGGGSSGEEVPFRSILFSYNDQGILKGTRFDNLKELQELIQIKPKKKPGIFDKYKPNNGSSGPKLG